MDADRADRVAVRRPGSTPRHPAGGTARRPPPATRRSPCRTPVARSGSGTASPGAPSARVTSPRARRLSRRSMNGMKPADERQLGPLRLEPAAEQHDVRRCGPARARRRRSRARRSARCRSAGARSAAAPGPGRDGPAVGGGGIDHQTAEAPADAPRGERAIERAQLGGIVGRLHHRAAAAEPADGHLAAPDDAAVVGEHPARGRDVAAGRVPGHPRHRGDAHRRRCRWSSDRSSSGLSSAASVHHPLGTPGSATVAAAPACAERLPRRALGQADRERHRQTRVAGQQTRSPGRRHRTTAARRS